MNSVALRLAKHLRASSSTSSSYGALQRSGRLWCSTTSESDNDERLDDNDTPNNNAIDEEVDDSLGIQPDLQLQGVDPKRGWNFRGVHKAILCGKVGQAPVQKILRNGKNVTIFTVGTGGMFDQRIVGVKDLPKPPQWHRVAVHNEVLGAYAVQQLVKNSSVYVEGEIETRIYNDSISGEIKSIPEICVRHDGRIRLISSGESLSKISFDDLANSL